MIAGLPDIVMTEAFGPIPDPPDGVISSNGDLKILDLTASSTRRLEQYRGQELIPVSVLRLASLTDFAFQACSFNHSDISPIEWNQ
jgi:hypothetical protein